MQKQKKIIVLVAILAVLGFAGVATAGPFYPYLFNNGSVFGGYFYAPFYPNIPQVTPVAPIPYYPAPMPLPPTVTPVAPTPMPPYYPAPTPQPYPYFPNTPQVTPVAPTPYYPTPVPQPIPTQYAYVYITDAGFNSDVVTIQVGTTVIWENLTSDMHGVVDANGMFTNYTIYPGGIHTFQFLNSGTYIYKDSFNGAVGTIVVQ